MGRGTESDIGRGMKEGDHILTAATERQAGRDQEPGPGQRGHLRTERAGR
jgi:hypothetical protein